MADILPVNNKKSDNKVCPEFGMVPVPNRFSPGQINLQSTNCIKEYCAKWDKEDNSCGAAITLSKLKKALGGTGDAKPIV